MVIGLEFVKFIVTRLKAFGLACEIFSVRFVVFIKKSLAQYIAIFECAHNLKTINMDYLRVLLSVFTTTPH